MPDTITPERLAELCKLAEDATPGPWRLGDIGDDDDWQSVRNDAYQVAETFDAGHDAEYIAAFDPPTVLALLDRIDELQARTGGEPDAASSEPQRTMLPIDVYCPYCGSLPGDTCREGAMRIVVPPHEARRIVLDEGRAW